jgi:hypothetical protein
MLDTTEKLKVTKTRKTVSVEEYEATLNLVRNTLSISESEALQSAGYSTYPATPWRKSGKVPTIAVNALKGLLVGHEIAKAESENKPLLLSNDQILQLAQEVQNVHLRAKLYREVARRLSPE